MAVRTPESGVRSDADADPSALDVAVASLAGPRRRRPTLVLVGGLFVGAAALLGAVVVGALTTTVGVLAAAVDLRPGQVIEAGDLRVVELTDLGDAATIVAADQSLVVGRTARGPIPAGTILSPGLFAAPGTAVPPGQVVVGAQLEPGAAPGPDLRAGDQVDLLVVSGAATGVADEPTGARVIGPGTIWSVERPVDGVGGRLVVSVLVAVERQTDVAQAAADGRLRLALTSAG